MSKFVRRKFTNTTIKQIEFELTPERVKDINDCIKCDYEDCVVGTPEDNEPLRPLSVDDIDTLINGEIFGDKDKQKYFDKPVWNTRYKVYRGWGTGDTYSPLQDILEDWLNDYIWGLEDTDECEILKDDIDYYETEIINEED